MRRAMSTYVYVKERLHPGRLEGLARGGAQAIEIFCARGHFDYTNAAHVKEIAAWFKGGGVTLHSLHAPLYADEEWGRSGQPPVNVIEREKRLRVQAMDEIKRAIEVAEQVPFRFLVLHLGQAGETFEDWKFEAALSGVEHLHAFAKPLGVQLALENIPNEVTAPEKLVELLKTLHFDDIGLCFDTGHAHLTEDVYRAFETMKPHIRTTHVHDNNKDKDAHLWPGKGNINWPEAMSLLAEAPHAPPVLMEIEGVEGQDVPVAMSEAFRTLEQAEQKAAR